MAEKNQYSLSELKAKRDKIALDLVDIYWDMKPPRKATAKQLSEFSSQARIAGERGKIGMKAIDRLEILIAEAAKQKPDNENVAGLTNDEIKLVMEYRNAKSKPASSRGKKKIPAV